MELIKSVQTSFGGGVVSPAVAQRPDLQKYQVSLARAVNAFIERTGGAVNRSGSYFIGATGGRSNLAVDLLTVGTKFGDQTNGATAWYNNEDVLTAANCARKTSAASMSLGVAFPVAKKIESVRIFGSSDQGYVSTINPNVTVQVRASNSLPSNYATDGVAIFTFEPSVDTLNESVSPKTATFPSNVAYTHWWVRVSHDGASNQINVASIYMTEQATDTSADDVAIIEFIASTDDTYILELGHRYMEFWRNGAKVLYPAGHPFAGNAVRVITPYSAADVEALHYDQSNDVLTISHPGYEMQNLTRYDHHDWKMEPVAWGSAFNTPSNFSLANRTDWNGTTTKLTYWFAVSAGTSDGTSESVPTNMIKATSDYQLGTPRGGVQLKWNKLTVTPEVYNIYRSPTANSADLRWIASVTGANSAYNHVGNTGGNVPPSTARKPFYGSDDNPFGPNNYPRETGYFQQRRVIAGTIDNPQSMWLSRTGNPNSLAISTPVVDTDAVIFAIAARQQQKILHVVPLDDLLVFTKSGEWRITGPDNGIVTPSSIAAKPLSNYGSADISPLQIGERILFIQDMGGAVRDLAYQANISTLTADDISVLVQHYFQTRKIKDWEYAPFPHSVVWVVMTDGTMLTLTYMKEEKVIAWTEHKTRGIVKGVAVVPENGQSMVYLRVNRYINGAWRRFIERLTPRRFTDVRDFVGVDCALSYDNPVSVTINNRDNGTRAIFNAVANTFTNGDTVDVVTATGPDGEFLAGEYVISDKATDTVSLKDGDGNYVRLPVGWLKFVPNIILRKKVSAMSGIDHLEGETVSGLADGNVVEGLVVTGGAVTLPFKAGRVHLGLSYQTEIETLALETQDLRSVGVPKDVSSLAIRVVESRGFEVSGDGVRYVSPKARTAERWGEPAKLYTEDLDLKIYGSWSPAAKLYIRQRLPLPLNVSGVVPIHAQGGK
jgi:hypothetical protein